MLKKLARFFKQKYFFETTLWNYTLFYALFLLAAYNYAFFKKLYDINSGVVFMTAATLCTYFILIACCTLLFFRHTVKTLSIAFALINSFVFYFMITYHTPVDKVMMLNTLRTDVYEVQDLLGIRMGIFVLFFGLLPAFLICKTNIIISDIRSVLVNKAALLVISLAAAGGIMLGGYRATDDFFHNHRDAKYYLIPVNYISASISVFKMRRKADHPFVTIADDAVIKKYWNNDKKNLIILVVGETARAANFSLRGYHRPTNAPLDTHKDELLYFRDVTACGTSTAVAVPCMFSKDGRQNFKIGSEEYTENLLDVLSKTGYKVIWRENNTGCQNNCDRVELEDFCTKKSCFDEILLTSLTEKIRSTDKDTAVVMHQTGSHGPAYYAHYPRSAEIYKDTCKTEVLSSCGRQELINTYDNTIYYTSEFLSRLISELKTLADEYNIMLLYSSDHGESLGENGIYLHAAPYDTAPKVQKDVPLLIWASDETLQNFGIDRACMENKLSQPFSHDNIFHSVLGFAGIQSDVYQSGLDLFAGCRKKQN